MTKTVTHYKGTREVGEDDIVNTNQLAAYFAYSRFTILNYKKAGYVFEFGHRTTPRHFRAWLKGYHAEKASAKTPSQEAEAKLARELSQLH